MGPTAAISCTVGATNTTLVILFPTVTLTKHGLTNVEYWLLAVKCCIGGGSCGDCVALKASVGDGLEEKPSSARHFPCPTDCWFESTMVECVLGLGAVGGLASVVKTAFITRSTSAVLFSVAAAVAVTVLVKHNSGSPGYRTHLVSAAVAHSIFLSLCTRLLNSFGWSSPSSDYWSISFVDSGVAVVDVDSPYSLHFLTSTKGKQMFLGRRAPT